MGNSIKLFLCGDVMTGRGIDQIMPYPSHPVLYERFVKNAYDYVELAMKKNGPFLPPVDFTYVWGNTIERMQQADLRIINLETSITISNQHLQKGINYRMHPDNLPCLTSANIDCCTLANNHVLDWGVDGLTETLDLLKKSGICYAGAGFHLKASKEHCRLNIPSKGGVLVFAYGLPSSGIPKEWQARSDRAGINMLNDLSENNIRNIANEIKCNREPNELIVVSIHWGENWGYEIPESHKELAHQLIDLEAADIIHGHSSHHFLGIEVYKNKPILYGCGDFINDYEGIGGYEKYRDDLGFMYFTESNPRNGQLISLQLVPTQMKNMRINSPENKDIKWMHSTLNRECKKLKTNVEWLDGDIFNLVWN